MDAINTLLKQNIKLVESSHEYILQSDPSIQFLSVTETIDSHFKPFDKWRIARILTAKNPKYKHITAEELVQQWNDIRDHGSDVHKELEHYINNRKIPRHQESKQGVKAIKEISKKFGDNLYSEVIVFSEKLCIAGIIDLIVHDKNNSCYIFDWKTTKNLYRDNGRNGETYITENIRDTNYNKYSLQLSAYNHLLSEFHNIPVEGQFIVHLTETGYEIIETEYQKILIKDLFVYSANNQIEEDGDFDDEYLDDNLVERKNYDDEYLDDNLVERKNYDDESINIVQTKYVDDSNIDLSNDRKIESQSSSDKDTYVYKDRSRLYTLLACTVIGILLARFSGSVGLGVGVAVYIFILIRTS